MWKVWANDNKEKTKGMNVEDIRKICVALPGVTEDIKWEHDLVFSVGGKMFCVVGLDQAPATASMKVTDENFDEMSALSGFKPAPYMAKHKWLWVDDINRLKKKEWENLIAAAYGLVKAKLSAKLQKQIGLL